MSDALSDPLLCAAILLGLAGLILALGLALQASANGSRRRSFWQEMADGHRSDEGRGAAPTPVAQTPVARPPVAQAPAAQAPVAPAPVTNDRPPEVPRRPPEPVTNDRPPEPVTNERPPVVQRRPPEHQDPPPASQRWVEEPAGGNGSDGDRARIATTPEVPSGNGVQEKDQRWLEELMARAKEAEESCGRADEASARVRGLFVPPKESAE